MLNSYKQTSLLRQEASLPNIPDTIFLETEGIGQIIKNMLQQLRHANINLTETLADQLRSNFETLSLSDTQEHAITELLQQGKRAALKLFN